MFKFVLFLPMYRLLRLIVMELSHYLVYILLSLVKTTSSFPSENRDFLGASDNNTDDDTFVINIAEDSDTADDLAKRVLSAVSALNNLANRVPNQQRGKLYRAERVRRKTLGKNERVQMIFGKDERVNLSSSREAQIYPYYTAVMLSSGCTGTLIGPQHVLTAAHCVHNGKKRLKKAKHLQVGKCLLLCHEVVLLSVIRFRGDTIRLTN